MRDRKRKTAFFDLDFSIRKKNYLILRKAIYILSDRKIQIEKRRFSFSICVFDLSLKIGPTFVRFFPSGKDGVFVPCVTTGWILTSAYGRIQSNNRTNNNNSHFFFFFSTCPALYLENGCSAAAASRRDLRLLSPVTWSVCVLEYETLTMPSLIVIINIIVAAQGIRYIYVPTVGVGKRGAY